MIRVRLIFCGGCNPSHDRLLVAGRLRDGLPPCCRFTEGRDTEADLEIIIQGCATACREPALPGARRTVSLTCPEEAAGLIRQLRETRPMDGAEKVLQALDSAGPAAGDPRRPAVGAEGPADREGVGIG